MRPAALILTVCLIAIVPPTGLTAKESTDPATAAAELRKKRAEAEAAEHEAERLKYEKQKAAAEAKFGFLPKSPAEGKAAFGEGGGVLETEFLVADALASAANYIAKAVETRSDILLVEGPESRGNVRLLSFQAEAYSIKRSAERALGVTHDLCAPPPPPPPPDDGHKGAAAGPLGGLFGAGALIGALGDMLKTDTTVTGRASSLTEEHLVRALLVAAPGRFRTTYLDSATFDPENDVIQELDCLGRYDHAIRADLSRFQTDDDKKLNAAQIARLTAAATSLAEMFDRLLKVEKDTPPLIGLLYADAELAKNSGSVLRVWVDVSGGTFVNRRNLWTNLGAPSLGMTGGAIVSYMLIDRPGSQVAAAGLLKCTTDLVSLRKAQRRNLKIGACSPLIMPQTLAR
jgi:hypothetical protein